MPFFIHYLSMNYTKCHLDFSSLLLFLIIYFSFHPYFRGGLNDLCDIYFSSLDSMMCLKLVNSLSSIYTCITFTLFFKHIPSIFISIKFQWNYRKNYKLTMKSKNSLMLWEKIFLKVKCLKKKNVNKEKKRRYYRFLFSKDSFIISSNYIFSNWILLEFFIKNFIQSDCHIISFQKMVFIVNLQRSTCSHFRI